MKRPAPLKAIFFTLLLSIVLFKSDKLFGQSQSGCTVTFPNNFDAQVDISSIYNPALCPSGDLVLSNLNDKNGNSTVTFDSDINLNSLTLNYKAGNNPLEIIIPAGVTVTIANDVNMNLSSTVQDKFLTVDGNLIVGGNLDFGNIDMEIDGTGTIDATSISGGGSTTCSTTGGGTGTCPTITAASCTDPSGLCTEPGTVTPVELIFFAGEEVNGNVSLNWATASEENFNYFEVQRAHAGTDFETVGEVEGVGNSFTKQEYSFEDKYPELGFNYYRLKSIDLDGTYEYSNVILVVFSSGIELQVVPNPSTGLISIKTNLSPSDNLEFVVTNQVGSPVYRGKLSAYNTQIDLSNLVKGIYIVRLNGFQLVRPQRIILR